MSRREREGRSPQASASREDAAGDRLRAMLRLRRRQPRRAWLGWGIVAAVGVLLLLVIWLLRGGVQESLVPDSATVVEQTLPPLGAFALYFGDAEVAGLQREVRYLPRSGVLEVDAQRVIEALFEGSLAGGHSPWPREATIQDLLNLLVTEDGESRIDQLQSLLEDIDHEVDLIHSVAEKMLEEQYGIFETQEWSLSDIKFQLNQIELQLNTIEGCSCP